MGYCAGQTRGYFLVSPCPSRASVSRLPLARLHYCKDTIWGRIANAPFLLRINFAIKVSLGLSSRWRYLSPPFRFFLPVPAASYDALKLVESASKPVEQ